MAHKVRLSDAVVMDRAITRFVDRPGDGSNIIGLYKKKFLITRYQVIKILLYLYC